MNKSIKLLKNGFESSSGLTKEFQTFFNTFKREFTNELETVNATNIGFNRGHFYVSVFYTIGNQAWYANIGDVRGTNPKLSFYYRKVKDYKDYTGESNRSATLCVGVAKTMHPSV